MIGQPSLDDPHVHGAWPDHRGGAATAKSHAGSAGWRRPILSRLVSRALAWSAAPWTSRIRHSVVRGLPIASGHVLEVGVGRGAGLPHYDRRLDVTGTDANTDALYRARNRVAAAALDHVSGLYRRPATALGFSDGAFDAVAAFFVFARCGQPRAVLAELVRVTRPGGRIVVVNRFAGDGADKPQRHRGVFRALVRRVGRAFGLETPVPVKLIARHANLDLIRSRALGPFGLVHVFEFAKRA